MSAEPNDEALVRRARAGEEDALSSLLVRYAGLVSLRAAAFSCALCEKEDLEQEGLLGVLAAVRGFDFSRGVSFRTFAGECVDNRILSYIRAVSRQDRRQGSPVSLSETDALPEETDPEALVLGKEGYADVMKAVKGCLSDYERQVLALYVEGHSYTQMGALLGKEAKSAENAMTRIRRKLHRELKK